MSFYRKLLQCNQNNLKKLNITIDYPSWNTSMVPVYDIDSTTITVDQFSEAIKNWTTNVVSNPSHAIYLDSAIYSVRNNEFWSLRQFIDGKFTEWLNLHGISPDVVGDKV